MGLCGNFANFCSIILEFCVCVEKLFPFIEEYPLRLVLMFTFTIKLFRNLNKVTLILADTEICHKFFKRHWEDSDSRKSFLEEVTLPMFIQSFIQML